MIRQIVFLLLFVTVLPAEALDWLSVGPNPSYSRDLAMGASTIALPYAPQSAGINPAGLIMFDPSTNLRASLFLNPGGAWHLREYGDDMNRDKKDAIPDAARMIVHGGAVQFKIGTLAAFMSEPVMRPEDADRYHDSAFPLSEHQNSMQIGLALHPRVMIGGRVDMYTEWDKARAEGYSYGIILRPRGINVGVQYQRFPGANQRVWHPLDRRSDQTTNAGLALTRSNLALSVQVMNLTESDKPAFLEPHAGFEWRPWRVLALRGGGIQYSRSSRWAWTAGIGILDANWLRNRIARLLVPDDILQAAIGVIYDKRIPLTGLFSATCAWRF